MKQPKLFLALATCFYLTAFSQSNILPVKGLESNHQGIFAWNVTYTKVGHLIPSPYNAFQNTYAYYYFATRDIGTYDGLSTTGMQGNGTLTGFSNLSAALSANGKTISDINIKMQTTTLGNDAEGIDWSFVGALESRKYTNGAYAILLNNDTLLTGEMPELNLSINYNSELTPYDDQTSGLTDYSTPTLHATSGEPLAVANALLADIGSYRIRLKFTSIQPAGQTEYRVGNTFGGFFEIQNGQIETGSVATSTPATYNKNSLTIFPTVATDHITVQLNEQKSATEICIVSLLGKTLIAKDIVPTTQNINIMVDNLDAGVYFCVIKKTDGSMFAEKFIKK